MLRLATRYIRFESIRCVLRARLSCQCLAVRAAKVDLAAELVDKVAKVVDLDKADKAAADLAEPEVKVDPVALAVVKVELAAAVEFLRKSSLESGESSTPSSRRK